MKHKINDRITIVTGFDPPPIPDPHGNFAYYAYVDGEEEYYGTEYGRTAAEAVKHMVEQVEMKDEDDSFDWRNEAF